MSKKQFFFGIILAAVLGGVVAAGVMQALNQEQPPLPAFQDDQNVKLSKYLADSTFIVPIHPGQL